MTDRFMKLKGNVLAVFATVLISACSTAHIEQMDNLAGMGVISDETSKFDNRRRVSVSPSFVADIEEGQLNWAADFMLGAAWVNSSPDLARIDIETDFYQGISGISFSIDGVVTEEFETSSLSDFSDDSTKNSVVLPLDILEQIVSAENSFVRLMLVGDEYVEGDLSKLHGRGGANTARYYISQRFLPLVSAAQ